MVLEIRTAAACRAQTHGLGDTTASPNDTPHFDLVTLFVHFVSVTEQYTY